MHSASLTQSLPTNFLNAPPGTFIGGITGALEQRTAAIKMYE